MSEDEMLELLREAHREPIAEAHYTAVRARVMGQIAARRRARRWWWAWALAAVVLLAVWVSRPPEAALRLPSRAALHVPAPVPPVAVVETPLVEKRVAVQPPARPVAAPVHRRKPAPATYAVVGPPVREPLVVKLVTNNPDIVIYWISGE